MSMRKLILPGLCGLAMIQGVWAAPDGWERGSAYNKLYNPKTVVTVEGTIDSINRDCHPTKTMDPGFAVTLKTAKGDKVEVQVGPIWFTHFYQKKWDAKVGDKVTVTGSQVDVGGKKVIMASQGKKGDLQMTVRGKTGAPVWDLNIEDF